MRPLRIVGWIFGFVALVLGGVATWNFLDNQTFITQASRTEGTVLAIQDDDRARGRRRAGAHAVLRFEVEGREVLIRTHVASSPPRFAVGDKVTVLYIPGDEADATIEDFWEQYLLVVIMGSLSVVFALIFVGMVGIPGWLARRRQQILTLGMPVRARVVEIRRDTSASVNGRNPWVLVAKYEDQTYTSHWLWDDPQSRYPVGSEVTVCYLPEKPWRYAFDLRDEKEDAK